MKCSTTTIFIALNFCIIIDFVSGLTCATGGGFKEKDSTKSCEMNDNFCIQLTASDNGRQTKEVQTCSHDTPTFTSLGVKCNSSGNFHIVHNGVYIDYYCCDTNLCNKVTKDASPSSTTSYSFLSIMGLMLIVNLLMQYFNY